MGNKWGFWGIAAGLFSLFFVLGSGACGPPVGPSATCRLEACTCQTGQPGWKACALGDVCSDCQCVASNTPEVRPEPPLVERFVELSPRDASGPDAAAPDPHCPEQRSSPEPQRPEPKPETPLPSGSFPASWEGIWKGDLEIYAGNQRRQTVGMELHTKPLGQGKATWKIVYIQNGQRQERNYILETVDAAKGHYRIDERNSIVIDSFLNADALVSQFSVSGNLIVITYRKEGRVLVFESTATRATPTKNTGGQGVPAVGVYFTNNYQRARLAWFPHP